ncbi:winged helix-turn-helix transcriptional regulator [Hymenobacter cellulosivorans]|uniref:Helix-turn-helix transcriptional regulator n=1 Tax=Hymenobacter cellulosivorans TaxID=2932249 RepID=A0ABY4F6F1_9BACT|nr:helix-turn-helix domain-containing protein [Hymenobacter cellulosivorans]UOQ51687.1 helix-turn-helix transcriptional regulator [Hymenobacter cellulosivorans]
MVYPPPHTSAATCTTAMRSVRDALDLLGGKWKLPIILGLSEGPKRFKQLQRDVTGITAKMLSKELKELEMNGLLTRHVQADTVPVAVTYTLAPYGTTLYPVIGALHNWGQLHRHRIMHTGEDGHPAPSVPEAAAVPNVA